MELKVGQQIGSYRIVQEIAHGQYAFIYKASHIILTSRIVALKFLYTVRIRSEEEYAQFFQEARILEQLQHPHILPVIDTNVYEQHPYTITEFAVHGSLRDRLRKQKGQALPFAEALEILRQIGEGLEFAHEHKVVHSDIKPENILFNASNSARISDFDIARSLQRVNTQASSLGGTPSYMAPEQFQGKVRKESDQYALGCIAYELFTGKRAFKEEDLTTLSQAHLHTEPQPPSQLNAEISQGIDRAILKALAKKYIERFESVAAFIQALSSALMEEKGHVGPGGHLVLKGERRQKAGEEEIYYEKTLVGEEKDEGEDPFAAVTVVDENRPVKRRSPVRKVSEKKVESVVVKRRVKDVADTPVVKKASSGRAKTGAAKKVVEREDVVVPKSAAMMAREAIMRPEEKAARMAAAKSGSRGKAAESNEEKKGVASKKRAPRAKAIE
jgi:serine/threonine protein kinase